MLTALSVFIPKSCEVLYEYIPLFNRVRGPYVRYRPSFFHSYGPSARRMGHEEKQESVTYGTDRANEVNKIFIIWLFFLLF